MCTRMKYLDKALVMVLLVGSIILPSYGYAFSYKYSFERAIEQKKSETSVFSIVQDGFGFLWFATRDGLWKYDGYTTREYRYNAADTASIGSSHIRSLLVDHNGQLWVGTIGGGLNKYNVESDSFIRYVYNPENFNSLSHNDVLGVYQDRRGDIWVCTEDGLNKYRPSTNDFKRFYFEEKPQTRQLNRAFLSVLEDSKNNFWVGGYFRGLFLFDRDTEVYQHVDLPDIINLPEQFSNFYIWNLFEDNKKRIWVSTRGQGLICLEPETLETTHFYNGAPGHRHISNNIVYSVLEDQNGIFWIGTENGLNIYDPFKGTMEVYRMDVNFPSSISNNAIWTIFQDRSGIIWLGGWEGYADKWDPFAQRFFTRVADGIYPPRPVYYNSLELDREERLLIGTNSGLAVIPDFKVNDFRNHVTLNGDRYFRGLYVPDLLLDSEGVIWVATNKGLFSYVSNPERATLRLPIYITVLFEDSRRTIWVGTQQGLFAYNRLNNEFVEYRSTPFVVGSLSHRHITSIYEDGNGVLWVGTQNGLNRLNMTTNSFTVFHHHFNDPTSLANGVIRQIYQDSRGILWVGTSAGLSITTDLSGKFRNFTIEEGLPGNIISSILEDESGNIWVSTNEGISKIEVSLRNGENSSREVYNYQIEFLNYGADDGLLDQSFRMGSCLKLTSGEVLFGGNFGVSSFFPDSIRMMDFPPMLAFTDLKVMNTSVMPGTEGAPIPVNIVLNPDVVLNYKQSVVTFDFVALNFSGSGKNQYAYIMEGFDQDWTDAGSRRSATYTNLNPGKYVFRVRAANGDGIWNMDGISLNIHVLPPPWRTWYAFMAYFILLASVVIGFGKLILAKQKTESRLKMEKVESDKIRELTHFKNMFFTNVSHEFRTPLTLIIAPLKELLVDADVPEMIKSQINLIHGNAVRLLRLINQLLEISKIEAGYVRLKVTPVEIVSVVRNIYQAFSLKAEELGIHYSFSVNLDAYQGVVDVDKIEKILYNLLSNAFKNTPKNGIIEVKMLVAEINGIATLEIMVKDNGPGIMIKDYKRIFDRFYSLNEAKSPEQSTGIGLSLSYQLALVHKGELRLQSEPGKGAEFILSVPVSIERYANEEISSSVPLSSVNDDLEIGADYNAIIKNNDVEGGTSSELILLVEDNVEVRQFIESRLKSRFRVITASNGEEAIDLAVDQIPDVVVSDVMMPRMDGMELCRLLKSDERTSHIPVVLLTARASGEDQNQGYAMGADAYIAKPFEFDHLIIRINNLIESRNSLRKAFGKGLSIEPSKVLMDSLDEKFIAKSISIIELHIAEPEFNIDILSQEIGMSRSQVFRKLKALTNLSPVEFIRMIRIKRAGQILEQKSNTISEVAYMVGFSDIDYFRKCFKAHFGLTPSRFMETKD